MLVGHLVRVRHFTYLVSLANQSSVQLRRFLLVYLGDFRHHFPVLQLLLATQSNGKSRREANESCVQVLHYTVKTPFFTSWSHNKAGRLEEDKNVGPRRR